MPAPWSKERAQRAGRELKELYIRRNKTISEIARLLGLKETGVYYRLCRLGIKTLRHQKIHCNNRNQRIKIPARRSKDLAEFIGILLGDGHLTPTQVTITLGKKERQYVKYVAVLMKRLFFDKPRQSLTNKGDWVVYLGSTELVRWLLKMGLAYNKVKSQVDIPTWCFNRVIYKKSVLRGLIDTDGSIYRLRSGLQISLCNRSQRLLIAAQRIFFDLGFKPSRISVNKVYLTRRSDLEKYFQEIGFGNYKHVVRWKSFQEKGN